MTTSIDSNVIIALWDKSKQNNIAAMKALDEAAARGNLVVSGMAYAELLGGYARTCDQLDKFFESTAIEVDWKMTRPIWEIAGLTYQQYWIRRTKNKSGASRGMLTDLLIGAHATHHGHSLVTQDKRLYRACFPHLTVYYA